MTTEAAGAASAMRENEQQKVPLPTLHTASSTQTERRDSSGMAEGNEQELHLLPLTSEMAAMYEAHGTYHPGDSGLDLFVAETKVVPAGATEFIKLGVKAAAFNRSGHNVGFLMMPRSSISKTPLRVANSIGLVDAGFRGELVCAVDNIKHEEYQICKGDRIVQAVFFNGEPFDMKIVDQLSQTQRGSRGWGSTEGVAARRRGSSLSPGGAAGPRNLSDCSATAVMEPRHQLVTEPSVATTMPGELSTAAADDENAAPAEDRTVASKKRSSSGQLSPKGGGGATAPQDRGTEDVAARKKQRMDGTHATTDTAPSVPAA